ncbi:tripartite tricarboxylate transporter substrate binding protein [Imbroritus primus]|uniref:Tripartite tricarboxylate transporter substrate binding protein n=1 Tax=Imbroritus primus TaxID=3058603 RepID=A0ACD3SQK3_9BURK|nr:tripartite tricarboxylate transporter substrate binding protein [Burkholderiaceae bacterium PBA]
MKSKLLPLSLIALFAGPAMASDFPKKELTMTVNYGAGSNTDVASRIIASAMEKELGKSIVVENRAGALGTMAVSWLAKQAPDPHRVGVVTYATQAISPHLMKVGYTMDDFQWVCGFGRYLYGVAVRSDSPHKTINDLIAAAKKDKGVSFGGASTPNLIALLELGRITGAKFVQIPYNSGADVRAALLGGHIESMVQNPGDILPHVATGEMRMLASASPIRWPMAPDVPTLKDAGYPVEVDSWIGLGVRAGAPADAVKRLEDACLKGIKHPDAAEKLTNIGIVPVGLTGEQYRDALKSGYQKMGAAIKAANIPRISN